VDCQKTRCGERELGPDTLSQTPLRCHAVAPNVCGINHIAGLDQLAAGRPYCWKCRKHTCDVCKETLTTQHFSMSQLKHRTDTSRNKDLRCRGCHTCESCDRVKRAEDFRGCDSRTCECLKAATSLCCDACKTHRPAEAFDRDVLHNAAYHDRKRVCGACEEQGYSVRVALSAPFETYRRTYGRNRSRER
jgi:hypothetical protein